VFDDEPQLVERAKYDPEAFGVLYDRHVAMVFGFAAARLENVAAAQDVTAETFLKAFRGMRTYRDTGRPFAAWLYRIAHNEVVSHLRRRRVVEDVSETLRDPSPSAETRAIDRLEAEALWSLVDQLPAQQRAAMILRFRDGLSCRDVGLVLGKSEAAVKQLVFRAVRRLRTQITSPSFDWEPARSALVAS